MHIDVAHRPWPVPARSFAMHMTWLDLAFLHWPLEPQRLRPLIPPHLELDTFDGQAWLGIVPFRMENVRPRFVPRLPWLSAFPELNVRTYVTAGGKPGVWFFSLDATNRFAVRAARTAWHLRYFDAEICIVPRGDGVHYTSRRTHRGAPSAVFTASYGPAGEARHSLPGTLEYFLTERYCLYAQDARGRAWRGAVHHLPWPLQPGEAEISDNTMAEQLGVKLPDTPPLVHFARRLETVAWRLEPAH
jgi:uncharacterized protein YqjF (DUF2071 family)